MNLLKAKKTYTLLLLLITFFTFSQNKKNILFIAVDDLKPILGCYGDNVVISPNIDELAQRGTVFLNNHCQQAICAPSRASLLTGLRPDKTKVWDLKTIMRDFVPDILTMPEHFKNNGYETVAVGKLFDSRSVDKEKDAPSWSIPFRTVNKTHFKSKEDGPSTGGYQLPRTKRIVDSLSKVGRKLKMNASEMRTLLRDHGGRPTTEMLDTSDDNYNDGQLNINAKKLLKELGNREKPFFLAVGYQKPHLPFLAPKKYWDLYKRENFKLAEWQEKPNNGPRIAMHTWGELKSYSDVNEQIGKNGLLNTEKQAELLHGYHASVSYIDNLIGELTQELKRLKLEENTIIVLWGDHGWHLGDHGIWCKHSNFEQATQSPLIIIDPSIKGNIKNDSPTEFVDIFPTLTELAKIPSPEGLDGTSLVPILTNKAESVKEFAISQYPRGRNGDTMGYSLRTDQYRYTEWHKNNYKSDQKYDKKNIIAAELYDYENDPLETNNFVDDKEYKAITKELANKLSNFLKKQEIH